MKATVISIIIAAAIIGGVIIMVRPGPTVVASVENVSMQDGKQIVKITAKDQYVPHVTAAKAGVPTIIRMETNGTFDCSSQLTIPSIGYRQMLPPTGTTDIALAEQKPGSIVHGICGMGMKSFQVQFN